MAFRNPVADELPRYPLIIGDTREERGSGATVAHIYPGTGQVTREIAMADASDVDRAVAAGRAAFPAWRDMPGDQRRNLFFKLAALFEAKSAEFAPSLVAENGSIAAYAPYMGITTPVLDRAFKAGGYPLLPGLTRDDYRQSFAKLLELVGVLHRAGVPIVAGTDGFGIELVR